MLWAVPNPLTFDAARLKVREMVLDVLASRFAVLACRVFRHSSALLL
jgi:hypothetical protein